MTLKNYVFTAIFAAFAFTANSQCPGPAQRTALINLQRANEDSGTRAYQLVMTDTCGNQRYVRLDSLIALIVDSIGSDSALQWNWYTTNGVTTSFGRTAYVKRTAQWVGLDTLGFMRHRVRPDGFNGSQSTIYNDSLILEYLSDAVVQNRVTLADTGIIISTGGDEARSVNILTDTVNWSSSFDPTLQIHNLLADGTIFWGIDNKTLEIRLDPDGTQTLYSNSLFSELGNTVEIAFDDGSDTYNSAYYFKAQTFKLLTDETGGGFVEVVNDEFFPGNSVLDLRASAEGATTTRVGISIRQQVEGPTSSHGDGITIYQNGEEEALTHAIGLGIGDLNQGSQFFSEERAFVIQSTTEQFPFDYYNWIKVVFGNDDTFEGDRISFYDSSYLWVNDIPSPTLADTSFHFWAGNGTGTEPGFMTLEQIRGADAPNIYNSNGQQTDNTRIDTIKQTIEFARLNTGSSFEPGFKVSARAGNRPSAQGWYFNSNADSILLYKTGSNVAFLESASMPFGLTAVSDYVFLDGDSIQFNYQSTADVTAGGEILMANGSVNKTVKTFNGANIADYPYFQTNDGTWRVAPGGRRGISVLEGETIAMTPGEDKVEIIIVPSVSGTVNINYTPDIVADNSSYSTVRYIYNGGTASTTVQTDQAWEFRDGTGDLGASFSLAAGEVCKLIWEDDATTADARFFVARTALAVNQFATLRPSQLTATTNNWAPTGFSTYSNQTIIFSGDGNFQTVTGLTAATRDGVTKTFRNDGTNCVVFAKQHTSSSGGNRFDFTKDLVFLPQMEATLKYDSVGADWTLVSTTYDHVSFGNIIETDLRSNSGYFDDPFWDYNAFGGTSNKSVASSTLPLRYFQLSTSTAATAYPTITSYTGEIWQRANGSYLRQYAKVRLDELSTGSEDFDIRWGWTNGTVDTNTVEGAWISYQREENSGGWTLKTNDGTTTTTTNCGAAISADTWYDLEIIYYPYGEVTVFIDGTRYTTTSTLPEAITTTPLLQIDKDNGTTARTIFWSAIELAYVNVSD